MLQEVRAQAGYVWHHHGWSLAVICVKKEIRFQKYTRKCHHNVGCLGWVHTQHYPLSKPLFVPAWRWQMTTNSRAWTSDQTSSALNDTDLKIRPSLKCKVEGSKEVVRVGTPTRDEDPWTASFPLRFPFVFQAAYKGGDDHSHLFKGGGSWWCKVAWGKKICPGLEFYPKEAS